MSTGSFPEGKEAGVWRCPPTPFSAEAKERVELYLYSPSGLSQPVLWWTLPLPWPFLYMPIRTTQNSVMCVNFNSPLPQASTTRRWGTVGDITATDISYEPVTAKKHGSSRPIPVYYHGGTLLLQKIVPPPPSSHRHSRRHPGRC
jgi:hypothetical protein